MDEYYETDKLEWPILIHVLICYAEHPSVGPLPHN